MHNLLCNLLLINTSGRQPRNAVFDQLNAIKTGHDHILRHMITVLLQHIDYRQCHCIIGADDRIREIVCPLHPLFTDAACRLSPEITIRNMLLHYRHPVLF